MTISLSVAGTAWASLTRRANPGSKLSSTSHPTKSRHDLVRGLVALGPARESETT